MEYKKLGELENYDDIEELLKIFDSNKKLENSIGATKKLILFLVGIIIISLVFFPHSPMGLIVIIPVIIILICSYISLKKKQYSAFARVDDICLVRYGTTYLNSLIFLEDDIEKCLSKNR